MRARNPLLSLLVFVGFAAGVDHANAVPITFEFTGIGSGSLYRADLNQTIAFQNTLIGATLVTDTSALQSPASNIVRYGDGAVAGDFAVAGFSVGEFANDPFVFLNSQQAVPVIGFGDSVDFDIFGLFSSGLVGYDLQSALATTVGFTYFPGITTIALANGNQVVLTEVHGSPNVHPSIKATLGTVSVPSPATVWLFLVGLVGIAVARRSRAFTRFRE